MLILTIAFYEKHCKPLLELGFQHWEEAFRAGIITENECNLASKNLGCRIPNLKEFFAIQSDRLKELQKFC